MKAGITRALDRYRRSFLLFTPGQKVVTVVGSLALLLAAFMVFRWASAPSYSPLYTDLAPEDASAVVEQLQADGIAYEIGGGGGTISVPSKDVYATRIALSGEGIPSHSSDGGYALLDGQDISTSQFKEQTDFKRAMEGELAATIEAIDSVDTAVVHLAMPPKQVFAEEQDPATASVLVDTRAGTELDPDQVQAIVHLVASSIDGLDPSKVTVADSTGRVLSDGGDPADGMTTGRNRQVEEYQDQLNAKVQTLLDQVFGPGNSSVQVTAVLDFDRKVTETTTYGSQKNAPTLSESVQDETYSGNGAPGGAGGVVGPDAQLETGGAGTDGSYSNTSTVRENGIDKVVEQSETAPGSIRSLHAAVVVDTNSEVVVDAAEIDDLVSAAIGLDVERGDTIATSVVPFDTSVEDANAAALAEAKAAEAAASRNAWIRNGVLGGVVLLLVGLAWRRSRRSAQAREDATSYVVEQLRQEQAERVALHALSERADDTATQLALAPVPAGVDGMRDELVALVERQPDEVAALLRGWLVERP
ncbi:flagellar basal-body MS-ring/collar protein FliF [Nocardioides sp. Soil805]|uniref:flagellar basal-body MS-ring/collar protein FliF n=1 Tax=Nocardioides sp. Soil805 TaxID=1736416 RepID=UPI000702F03C|nr:flagellar basal-body MS-ring/collar protein FliF [Nocardioides sp. Soil805]KRF37462.1 flagellar M-ring protein FliF [Nocardioides sp. Soil805]